MLREDSWLYCNRSVNYTLKVKMEFYYCAFLHCIYQFFMQYCRLIKDVRPIVYSGEADPPFRDIALPLAEGVCRTAIPTC